MFRNEKRYKKLPHGTPLASPGYWLAVASPRSLGLLGPQGCPSSIEQGHWNGMTSTIWWGLSLMSLQLPLITPWGILGVS